MAFNLLKITDENLTQQQFENMSFELQEQYLLEQYLKDPCGLLMEMANFVGNKVKKDTLPFSFYTSTRKAVHGKHAIRVKLLWNPSKMCGDCDGFMELHGNYEYVIGSHKYKPTAKELTSARNFFKKYKVMFSAIWEEVLEADNFYDYLKGELSFNDLVDTFDVGADNLYELQGCYTFEELEQCVRKHKMFTMND